MFEGSLDSGDIFFWGGRFTAKGDHRDVVQCSAVDYTIIVLKLHVPRLSFFFLRKEVPLRHYSGQSAMASFDRPIRGHRDTNTSSTIAATQQCRTSRH